MDTKSEPVEESKRLRTASSERTPYKLLMEALDASEKEKNEIEEIAMEKLAIMSNEVADIKAIHRLELAEQLGEYAELRGHFYSMVDEQGHLEAQMTSIENKFENSLAREEEESRDTAMKLEGEIHDLSTQMHYWYAKVEEVSGEQQAETM